MVTASDQVQSRVQSRDRLKPGPVMAISGYLVAGTYERTLCGYTLDGEGSFTSIFNQPAHLGPVKAVASAGRFLVSGGSDEEIR